MSLITCQREIVFLLAVMAAEAVFCLLALAGRAVDDCSAVGAGYVVVDAPELSA